MFATSEVPQGKLGFSPYRLLFGCNIGGTMYKVRELWSYEVYGEHILSIWQYVVDLRNGLEPTYKLAYEYA